jgi:hypothetical protein
MKIAAMHPGACGHKRLGAGFRAREAQHLMACVNELWNDGGTDKAGSSGNEDTHLLFPPLTASIAQPSRI